MIPSLLDSELAEIRVFGVRGSGTRRVLVRTWVDCFDADRPLLTCGAAFSRATVQMSKIQGSRQ